MRKSLLCIICLILLLLNAGSLGAKDKYSVVILPFSLHSAENIDYLKQGIDEMLTSRISTSDKIDIVNKNTVAAELKKSKAKDLSTDDAYALGKKLRADYVIWGNITKIGNSVNITGKLLDIAAMKSDVGISSQSLDDVIPKINDFSENVLQRIVGITPQASQQPTPAAPAGVAPPAPQSVSRESQIIASMKSGGKRGGTLTAVINSEYINAPEPLNRKGFWMSQKILAEFKGMDIGDVNNDGINEIVTIDKNSVYIYQKTENDLKLLEKIKGKPYDNYIAVDVADINRNGVKEIIVTSLNDTLLDSFILEFKNGKYEMIASDIRWFLRVIETSASAPMLLGQSYGLNKPFDAPIYEIVYRNGKYIPDEKKRIPLGLSIYGLNIDDIGIGGGEKIIALDDLGYIYITEKTEKSLGRLTSIGFASDELIWKSDEIYGGSNNYIENIEKFKADNDRENSGYVNMRILTYDTNNDGKKEIIVVKNLSSVGRIFKHLNVFTSSEIYDLEWDGMGLAENWKTKKINGYVADYCIKDVDNDGKPEIVLALNLNVGTDIREKSVIVVYKLDTKQDSKQ